MSRTKRHRQSHNNRLITIILVAIIILIAVGSLIYGLARQSAMNKPDNSMAVSSEQTSQSSSTHRKKAEKSASQQAASSSKKRQRHPQAKHKLLVNQQLKRVLRRPLVRLRQKLPARLIRAVKLKLVVKQAQVQRLLAVPRARLVLSMPRLARDKVYTELQSIMVFRLKN